LGNNGREGMDTRKPLGKSEIVMGLLVAIAVIWFAASSKWVRLEPDPPKAAPVAQQVKSAPPSVLRLRAETVIQFPDGTWACTIKDDLYELLQHGIKGEATKANALSVEHGGSCAYVKPGERVRIIAAEYNPSETGIGLLEIVGEKNQSPVGAWALSVGAQPAR